MAINGERFNAHTFIPDTIEKGALCVVSHEDLGDTDYPYILVEATGQALLDIAKLYRDSFDVKVVGITGSVGKTSTKEMIASVLAQKYKWASIILERCASSPLWPARISASLPTSALHIWNF